MKKKMIAGSTIAAVVVATLLIALTASGVLVSSQTVQNSGIIASANVGIYSDSSGTQSLSSVDWGILSPGNSVSRTVYVRNTGNVPLTLSLTTSSWSPTNANGPISLTWNRENTVLNANQVMSATLTLSISSNTNGVMAFSFNIVVTGAN